MKFFDWRINLHRQMILMLCNFYRMIFFQNVHNYDQSIIQHLKGIEKMFMNFYKLL
jgi:hypothetical protein